MSAETLQAPSVPESLQRQERALPYGALPGAEDLSPAERASCPPLLLLGDDVALLDQGLGVLTRLLSSNLRLQATQGFRKLLSHETL